MILSSHRLITEVSDLSSSRLVFSLATIHAKDLELPCLKPQGALFVCCHHCVLPCLGQGLCVAQEKIHQAAK